MMTFVASSPVSRNQALDILNAHFRGNASERNAAFQIVDEGIDDGIISEGGLRAWLDEQFPSGYGVPKSYAPYLFDELVSLSATSGVSATHFSGQTVPARLGAVTLQSKSFRTDSERTFGLGEPKIDWGGLSDRMEAARERFEFLVNFDPKSAADQAAFRAWTGIKGDAPVIEQSLAHWSGTMMRRTARIGRELSEKVEAMMLLPKSERASAASEIRDQFAEESALGLERESVLVWFLNNLNSDKGKWDGIVDRVRSGELPKAEGCRQLEDFFHLPRGALQRTLGQADDDLFERLLGEGQWTREGAVDEVPLAGYAEVVGRYLFGSRELEDRDPWFSSSLSTDAYELSGREQTTLQGPINVRAVHSNERRSPRLQLAYATLAERLGQPLRSTRTDDLRARIAYELLGTKTWVDADGQLDPEVARGDIDGFNAAHRPTGEGLDALLGDTLPSTPAAIVAEKITSGLSGGIYPGTTNSSVIRNAAFRADRMVGEVQSQLGQTTDANLGAYRVITSRVMERLGTVDSREGRTSGFQDAHRYDDSLVDITPAERASKRLAFEIMRRPELRDLYARHGGYRSENPVDTVTSWFRNRRGQDPVKSGEPGVALLNAKQRTDTLVAIATDDLDDSPASQVRDEVRTLVSLAWGRCSSNGSGIEYVAELIGALDAELQEAGAGAHAKALLSAAASMGFTRDSGGVYRFTAVKALGAKLKKASEAFNDASEAHGVSRFKSSAFDPAVFFSVMAP